MRGTGITAVIALKTPILGLRVGLVCVCSGTAPSKRYHGCPCLTCEDFGLQINQWDLRTLQLMLSLWLMLPVELLSGRFEGTTWRMGYNRRGGSDRRRKFRVGYVWGCLAAIQMPLFVARNVGSGELCEDQSHRTLTQLKKQSSFTSYLPLIKQSQVNLRCCVCHLGWAWGMWTALCLKLGGDTLLKAVV